MTTGTVTRRIALGATAAIFAAAAVGAALAPWPTIAGGGPADAEPRAPHASVTPVPAETVLACDGPILALGRDATDASGMTVVSDVDLTAASDGGEPDVGGRIDMPGVGESALVVQAPDGENAVPVAASVSARLDADDVSGLVTSTCAPGQPESWLVGARVSTGVTDILVLQNPSDVTATVAVEVFGVEGGTTPSAGSVAIPAQSQRALPVAALAGAEESPVLRVTSDGAPVRATLQSSSVATLDPNGADLQAATLPANEHVIPRVTVTDSAEESGTAGAVLRLLGTAPDGGAVEIEATSIETGERAFEATVDLEGQAPVEVGLSDLEAGNYTVRMTSEAPFVTAALQTAGRDYGWAVPSEPVDAATLVAVPDGASAYALALANTADAATEVVVSSLDGDDEERLTIDPGATEEMRVPAGETLRIAPESGSVAASVSRVQEDAVATLPVLPDPATPEPVIVYP